MMKTVVILFVTLLVVLGFALNESIAGQLCWTTTPFSNLIKVSVTTTGNGHKLINGFWDTPGGRIPVTGTFEKESTGTNRVLTLHGVWLTSILSDCLLYFSLSSTSTQKWEGDGSYQCTGMDTPTAISLTRTSCTTLSVAGTQTDVADIKGSDPNSQ